MSPGSIADLAVTSHDGRLSIWNGRLDGRLKHEFVPSAHLASTASCLAWMPNTPARWVPVFIFDPLALQFKFNSFITGTGKRPRLR